MISGSAPRLERRSLSRDETAPEPLETAYVWDIASDRLEWQTDAASILGIADLSTVATGDAFAARIASADRAAWRSAVLDTPAGAASSQNAPYRIRFAFEPDDPETHALIWLEDRGRRPLDTDGRPVRAHGVIHRVDARYFESEHLLHLAPGDDDRETLARTRLFEAVAGRVRQASRTGRPAALMMIAINGLDAINARLGPEVGDEFIAAVGRLLQASLAEADAIVRYASNTFAIVLDNCSADDLPTAADRMIAHVENATIATSVGSLKTSIAIGSVALPVGTSSAADAIAAARTALERAKGAQRSRHVTHSEKAETEATNRKSVAREIASALEENRLVLALQPIVDAASGQRMFYEGLLRLKRPDGTLLAAADFIEDAEQLGIANLLDLRALELALALLVAHPRLKLCLNVSALTAGDKDWIATLEAKAAAHADLAPRLTIEITETAMIHDLEGVRAFVERLRKIGCRIAIDDFGTGYTSFRHLKTLTVDMLKIDGLFMKDLPNDPQGRIIVGSMIEMARGLGLETVAEWVSDPETAEVLRGAGATYLQGFLFAGPLTADELEERGELL